MKKPRKKGIKYQDIPKEKKDAVWYHFHKKHNNTVIAISNEHGLSEHHISRIINEHKP